MKVGVPRWGENTSWGHLTLGLCPARPPKPSRRRACPAIARRATAERRQIPLPSCWRRAAGKDSRPGTALRPPQARILAGHWIWGALSLCLCSRMAMLTARHQKANTYHFIPKGRGKKRNPHTEMPGAARNATQINHPGPVRPQKYTPSPPETIQN